MNYRDLPTLNACVNKLMGQIEAKRFTLHRCENSQGTGHDVRRMVRLREEIASLETRLARAERLQEEALASPFRCVGCGE